MKRLKEMWKTYKTIKEHSSVLKVCTDIFDFVTRVHKEQKPMLTQIVLLEMGTGEKIGDFVSLWAGFGKENPIERIRQLKAQNIELKRLLTLCSEKEISDEDKQLIQVTLRAFKD